jgi:arylsulfatase A-like enzyme
MSTPRVILIGAALAGLVPAATFAAPPNVVMIVSDDQAWTDFGFMGHPTIRTPHLDRLARESATFTRGYVPSSLCRPSLATMITGLYPHQHGISGNDPPKGTDRSEMLRHIRRTPTLPRMLGELGYVSLQTGKWWEGAPENGGFTAGMTHGDPARRGRHGDDGLKIGRDGMQPIFDFIDNAGDRPFFVWYAPLLPHSPHTPPQRLLDKYTADGKSIHVARYQAMCEWFDESCGELLDYLDRKQLTENTLVVFVTDNGWIQDQNSPRFAPKSKRSPYDGGLRTPIMLRWPGRIPPGRHEALVSSIDLAPTILKAAGLEPTDDMPGLNLLDVIAAGGKTGRNTLFGEIFDHDVADIDRPAASLQYRWCVDGRWKLILPAGSDERVELYDLAADPHELHNIANEHPDRVARLTQAISDWWPAN